MKNNYLEIKKEGGKIVVSSSDGVFSSITTLDNKEAFKNYCEHKAKEWRESTLGNYANWSKEDRKKVSDKWANAKNLQYGEYNLYFNIEDKKDIFRKEVDSLAKSLGITDYILEINK